MDPASCAGVEAAPCAKSSRFPARLLLGLLLIVALAPVTVAFAATHRVAPGETLSGIADTYGVSLSTLASSNGIANADRILAGQVLDIPAPGGPSRPAAGATRTHTVQPGDTLGGIAGQYGIAPSLLASVNHIDNPNLVQVGQRLVIPSGAASAASAGPVVRTHVVAAGDSLSGIALHYGVSLSDLIRLNHVGDPSLIVEGQLLTLPDSIVQPGSIHPEVRDVLRRAEQEFDLPAGLLQAIAWQESGWQQHVVSDAGAVGVTQLLPTTALWALESLLGTVVDWETSALDNARVGASVLGHYLDLSGGDVRISVAAYYQGWTSVHETGLYDETKDYVASVLALWDDFR